MPIDRVRRKESCIVTAPEPRRGLPASRDMVQKMLAVLPLALVAACEAPSGPTVEYRPGEAGTVDHALCLLGFAAVPVREVNPGHHLVEATINGRTGNFVLDTGANVSVIDVSQAERFGVSAGRGGPGSARQIGIDSFEIGPITVRQDSVVTADLGQLLGALGKVAGAEVAGIVGQDVMNEHRAIIDVSGSVLYLMEEDRDPAPVPAERCAAEGASAG